MFFYSHVGSGFSGSIWVFECGLDTGSMYLRRLHGCSTSSLEYVKSVDLARKGHMWSCGNDFHGDPCSGMIPVFTDVLNMFRRFSGNTLRTCGGTSVYK